MSQVAATSGYNVTLVEVNSGLLENAQKNIKKSLERVAKKQFKDNDAGQKKFVDEVSQRIIGSVDVKSTIKSTDLVIEAIIENIKIKHELFSSIDSLAPAHTIFASNTSSLSIAEIASVTQRKDRFGGLHFFNPVPVMKLLEIIRTADTSEQTYNAMKSFGESIGKACITCKDTPGFVVNRLLVPYMAEAVRLLERGDASARDIDTAMKLGAGYPMGPLELADYVGLDTTHHILKGWNEKFPDEPLFKVNPMLEKLVSEGKTKMSKEGSLSVKNVTIFGGGQMGSGIAHVNGANNNNVSGARQENDDRQRKAIREFLQRYKKSIKKRENETEMEKAIREMVVFLAVNGANNNNVSGARQENDDRQRKAIREFLQRYKKSIKKRENETEMEKAIREMVVFLARKSSCRNCNYAHVVGKCPAYGKECNNCGKLNHFAMACTRKRIREIKMEAPQSYDREDDSLPFTIDSISKMLNDANQNLTILVPTNDFFRELREFYDELLENRNHLKRFVRLHTTLMRNTSTMDNYDEMASAVDKILLESTFGRRRNKRRSHGKEKNEFQPLNANSAGRDGRIFKRNTAAIENQRFFRFLWKSAYNTFYLKLMEQMETKWMGTLGK
ncbi:Hydroxyacyl-coenzyme A dehydrogenase, mitochondrial [Pseudolycoriella hygida]|uniref:3-hydroxyacyl-CoA dehydrogenase n=1 Tax=Pseudolycoriella hygida TaxID=35572 RepID=A0A9Q0N5H8_9DIPT|nr:Hydroxyacyl-coenzyme A dehydrogenase, mitochondrial [Pseudolycoriella hygida]